MDVLKAIQNRTSVRTYADKPVSEATREKLQQLCRENKTGPFGVPVRFGLLDLSGLNREELRSLGTYGVIRGARLFILGAVQDTQRGFEDLGYRLEKIILEATAMGLGTCWLGGTFRRGSFASRMRLAKGELLPAITPVGYPAEQVALADRMLRFGAGSRRRKPWAELFFAADGKTPLTEGAAGNYREALEAVRMGPSASNRQPWRILKDEAGRYCLYLKENRLYNRILGQIRLQNIDIGIAMCHFELAARQQGDAGRWDVRVPGPAMPGLEHIATWFPQAVKT